MALTFARIDFELQYDVTKSDFIFRPLLFLRHPKLVKFAIVSKFVTKESGRYKRLSFMEKVVVMFFLFSQF